MDAPSATRSGFCAIVGRPNVGKSTLLNALVGTKVAITTPVPQTTRHAIRGILHRVDAQVVFVDTPGLHKPKTLLGTRLNDTARQALSAVDAVLFVVDGAAGVGRGDAFVAGLLADVGAPVIAVLNKVDRLSRPQQLPRLHALAGLGPWDEVVPASAARGEQVDVLADLLVARMPEGPAWFPEDEVTDQPLEQLLSEVIREKALVLMREEVPHSIAVVIEEVVPGDAQDVQVVRAMLYVERDSQKGIVIGKGGVVLQQIGTRARPELALLLGSRVHLDLRVKLAKEWQRDPRALERFGY